MSKSTAKTRRRKGKPGRPPAKAGQAKAFVPPKPYRDFPLTPHSGGKWMKKIHGRICYFGRWGHRVQGKLERIEGDGWQDALTLYEAQREDLYAGRTPRVTKTGEGLLLKDLCNKFLTAKDRKHKAGEITARTFREYQNTTDLLIGQFGKERLVDDLASDDFEALRAIMAERWGPVRLANAIQRVKTVFKYGYESGIMEKPVRYGPEFVKPSAAVLRKHRAENGTKMFTAKECRQLIDAADNRLKAMILLALNCGFGNSDCARLPVSAFDHGWINYPRPKTGIPRRCPLWPETVKALEAIASQEGRVFVTDRGNSFDADYASITKLFRRLLENLGLHRRGRNFYSLRHVFRTVADGCKDGPAIRLIMGHSDGSIDAVYRERIEDDRLLAVAEHVRAWLFPKEGGGQ